MEADVNSSGAASLPEIEAIAIDLVRAFRALFDATIGPDARPNDLVRVLKIDKSLASRLVRAISTDDPYESLHETAAPRGLGRAVEACRRAGAPANAVDETSRAIQAFDDLLGDLPDGRKDLATILGARVERAPASAEQHARRSVFRGLVHLRGFRTDTVYTCGIFLPNADDPSHVDFARISARF